MFGNRLRDERIENLLVTIREQAKRIASQTARVDELKALVYDLISKTTTTKQDIKTCTPVCPVQKKEAKKKAKK
ncbi:hypothetical protein UFOVP1_18 [uncultured Caudovirales phage]|uniref:Uncharacterized protein n=1 Tax=uncultured Caudovirales phage TaxID=2100421 RepID=A0A6J5KJ70_9CAUD|nr:hypothetical protein UFOVP1_18 [uncultured Caudovirales phage]